MIDPVLFEFYQGTPLVIIEEEAVAACVVLDLYDEEVCRGTVSLAMVSRTALTIVHRTVIRLNQARIQDFCQGRAPRE